MRYSVRNSTASVDSESRAWRATFGVPRNGRTTVAGSISTQGRDRGHQEHAERVTGAHGCQHQPRVRTDGSSNSCSSNTLEATSGMPWSNSATKPRTAEAGWGGIKIGVVLVVLGVAVRSVRTLHDEALVNFNSLSRQNPVWPSRSSATTSGARSMCTTSRGSKTCWTGRCGGLRRRRLPGSPAGALRIGGSAARDTEVSAGRGRRGRRAWDGVLHAARVEWGDCGRS